MLDIYYRAGGLMLVNPIIAPGLLLELHPPTLTSKMEQLEGYAEIALAGAPIKAGDALSHAAQVLVQYSQTIASFNQLSIDADMPKAPDGLARRLPCAMGALLGASTFLRGCFFLQLCLRSRYSATLSAG